MPFYLGQAVSVAVGLRLECLEGISQVLGWTARWGRMPFLTLVIFNSLATTILRRFGFGEVGARTTAGSIVAALPCSMLCWSADWALLGKLIVASVIIAYFNIGFGSVDAVDVSGRMAADVAQDMTVSQICKK